MKSGIKERDLYPKLSKIIAINSDKFIASAFELKVARGKKFYKRQLEEHQERALKMLSRNGVYHKISDMSISAKPFDSFLLKGDGYVVIYWEQSKKWYFIHIKNYLDIPGSSFDEVMCSGVADITI